VAEDHQNQECHDLCPTIMGQHWLLKEWHDAVGSLKSKVEMNYCSDAHQIGRVGIENKELAKPNAATAIVEELEINHRMELRRDT